MKFPVGGLEGGFGSYNPSKGHLGVYGFGGFEGGAFSVFLGAGGALW